jgi:RNA polymerase sigma factor (sigma-70 family)
MRDETAIGGSNGRFPATRWSLVERTRSRDDGERRLALQALVEAYWKPIYKHLRIRWRRSNEDAKDLTQGFLTLLIEKDLLDAYDPGVARLRTYLRLCLDRFVQNRERDARRLKRGGGALLVALDFEAAEGEVAAAAPAAAASGEDTFEREWLRALFARAVEALESDCRARGREADFRLFERYDLDEGAERPTYSSLAAELGLSVTTVTNRLAAVRRRFRGVVLDTLRQLCASEEEFRQEARTLFGWDGG